MIMKENRQEQQRTEVLFSVCGMLVCAISTLISRMVVLFVELECFAVC